MAPEPSSDLIFQFERDFAGSLRCIPMAVRLKLDQCGVKVSLRQWSRFDHDDRARLLAAPCDGADGGAYRQQLVELIRLRTGQEAEYLPIEPYPPWEDTQRVPEQIQQFAANNGVPAPDLEQWRALTVLQRFALLKLSRAKHDNVNFVPALHEFGLA